MTMVNVVPLRTGQLKKLEEEVKQDWVKVLDLRYELSAIEERRYEAGRAREEAIRAYNEKQLALLTKHWDKLGYGWCTRCNKVWAKNELELTYVEEMCELRGEKDEARNGLFQLRHTIYLACWICREHEFRLSPWLNFSPVVEQDNWYRLVRTGAAGERTFENLSHDASRRLQVHIRFVMADLKTHSQRLQKWGVDGLMEWDREACCVRVGGRHIDEDVIYELLAKQQTPQES